MTGDNDMREAQDKAWRRADMKSDAPDGVYLSDFEAGWDAALEWQSQQAQGEPVEAQHRFRHPQKTAPNWSAWGPTKIDKTRPKYEIDAMGYEVEYRLLYAAPPAPAAGRCERLRELLRRVKMQGLDAIRTTENGIETLRDEISIALTEEKTCSLAQGSEPKPIGWFVVYAGTPQDWAYNKEAAKGIAESDYSAYECTIEPAYLRPPAPAAVPEPTSADDTAPLKRLIAHQREQIAARDRELANLRSAVAYEAAILDTFLIGSGDEFPAHEGERVLINARRGLLNLVETGGTSGCGTA